MEGEFNSGKLRKLGEGRPLMGRTGFAVCGGPDRPLVAFQSL